MKFHKNGHFLQAFKITCFICIAVSVGFSIFFCEILWDLIFASVVCIVILLIPLEFALKGGLFYDSVCCDDHGIRIITRKETYDCPWEDIEMLKLAYGSRGNFGWVIYMYSQTKYFIGVASNDFPKYVRKVAPNVKIQERK